jgi:Secretion system C-terminal sorting domain/Concanavalin A-like lectin/glucanases superfamily
MNTNMKTKIYLFVFSFVVFYSTLELHAQSYNVPEILYYKFNNGSTTTPNYAIPGQGTNPATLVNMMMGPGGEFDSALIGNGGTGTTTYMNSGWNMNLGTSSWTISLWLNDFPGATGTSYLFGNDITTSFRCFTNGAAGPGNITLRGNGITNVDVTGVLPGPSVVHFVYDATVPAVRTYVNGVFQNSVSQVAFNFNAAVPFKVGSYGTATSIPVGALIDEFRFYNRALSANEISATWNQTLPFSTVAVNPNIVCDYGLIPQYPGGALGGHAAAVLGDTLYIAGGSVLIGTATNPSASTTVTRYAISSNQWSSGRSLPTAKVGGDLVKCGNYLYYIGGGSTTLTGDADFFAYRYSQDSGWSSIANIPTAVSGNVAESWGDSVIYCVMGGWAAYYRGIQIYKPSLGQWSRANDSLPATFGRRSFAGGLEGNKIYVAAGYSGTFRKDFWIGTIGADAATISWVQKQDVPCRGTGTSRPGGHAVNNRFYVVAGETTPAPAQQDSIYIWSITDSSWLPQIITGRGANTASNYWGIISSSIVNNKVRIYIPGGFFPTTVNTTKLLVLTDSLDCIMTNANSNYTTEVPQSFRLEQNYPNPFNPKTIINFQLSHLANVELKVYDILGKEVISLVNGKKDAGSYSVEFDGSNFASGIYFYKLNADNFSDTKRMVLIK